MAARSLAETLQVCPQPGVHTGDVWGHRFPETVLPARLVPQEGDVQLHQNREEHPESSREARVGRLLSGLQVGWSGFPCDAVSGDRWSGMR